VALLKLPSTSGAYMMTPSGNRIIYRGRHWCVLSSDGSWVLSRHDTLDGARQWKKSRALEGQQEPRHLHLRAATGQIRTAMFEDREHVVVPVVALVEGVLFPVNAETPELVLASEFSKTPQGWDGRPVMPDHPSDDRRRISANDPKTLERLAFGKVFHTKADGKRLCMEAWLDPARAARIGAQDVIDRIRAGKMIEVSVGCFVMAEDASGHYNGQPYKAIWREIVPDHLALLPEGTLGACSNKMGCGTPRAAMVHLVTAEGATLLPKEGEDMAEKDKPKTWRDKVAGFHTARVAGKQAPKPKDPKEPKAAAGMSDDDLREAIEDALRATVPGFLGVDSVFQQEGLVVYACAPSDEIEMIRCSFSVDANGAITLGGDMVEVEPITTFVPVDEQYEDASGDGPVGASGKRQASAGCGCGGAKTEPAPTEGGQVMASNAKQERLKKLLAAGKSTFTEADLPVLEKTLTDEQIAVLETAAAAAQPKPKEKTEEEFLAEAPESIKAAVKESRERLAARKTELLATMKAAKQNVYDDKELEAMDVPALEKLTKLAVASASVPGPRLVDMSGRGLPKTETKDENEVPAPPDMGAQIREARAKK
jgi:hypothetical protein